MSLSVQQLTKTYGTQVAVNAISFTARPGEIVGFLGPNGAGKSTTMKIATGYLPPTQGTVTVNGKDVVEDSMAVRRMIGYLPEHNPLYLDMYVHEYLRFIGTMYGLRGHALAQRVKEMVALCGLTREQNKKIGALSKGYRQRVGLAQALIHDPQVLILDEPTTGLDPNQLTEIRNLIKRVSQEKTVVFSTHIMQEVQALCDRVVIIHQGNIVANSALADLQSGTTKEDTKAYHISVEFTQAVEEALLTLLPGVKQVQAIQDNHYEIYAEEDVRPTLFHWACEHHYTLIGIQLNESKTHHSQSLEEIFRSLTTNEPITTHA